MDKMLPPMFSTEQEKTIKESKTDVTSFMLQQQEVMLRRMEEKLVSLIATSKAEVMQRMIDLEEKVQESLDACSVTSSRADKTMEEQHFLSNHMIQGFKDIKNNMSMTSASLDFIIRTLVPDITSLKTSVTLLSNKFDSLESLPQDPFVSKTRDKMDSDMSSKISSLDAKVYETNFLVRGVEDNLRNVSNSIRILPEQLLRSRSFDLHRKVFHETMEVDDDNERDTLVYKELQSIKNKVDETNDIAKSLNHIIRNTTENIDEHSLLRELSNIDIRVQKMETNFENYNRKVVNNISDLWKMLYDFTNLTNFTSQNMNATAFAIDRDLNSINYSLTEDFPSVVNEGFETMETKFKEFSDGLTQFMEVILFNQKSFSQSCQRIQLEESQVYDEFDFRLESMNETLIILSTELNNTFNYIKGSLVVNNERLKKMEDLVEKLISLIKRKHLSPNAVGSPKVMIGESSSDLIAEHLDIGESFRERVNIVQTSQHSNDNP
jgi:hypothetical protein